ncbi:hypothetical protein BRD01_12325 [Halobacteriales archaeon QS_8_65_32]|nr:MAG: hypothetical protein BRD01_12325 [Halobacteriales archaeon QS_8_65_32]
MRFPSLAAMLDRTVRYRPIGLGTRAVRSNRRPSKRRVLTPDSDLGPRLSNPGYGPRENTKNSFAGSRSLPAVRRPGFGRTEGETRRAGRDGI